jgi:TRAP transporter TAXI family solute receptor
MKINRFFLLFFVLLGLFAVSIFYFTRPTIIKAVVATQSAESARLITAFAHNLRRDTHNVRIRVTTKTNYAEVLKAMETGEADLGVVRSDSALPKSASVIAILQKNPLTLLVPLESDIQTYAGLVDKRVGVVTRSDLATNVLERVLGEYEVDTKNVTFVRLAPQDVSNMTKPERIEALFLIGPPDSLAIRDTVNAYAKEAGAVRLVPIKESEAIHKRVPYLDSFDIVAGAFGGNPPRPAETVKTLATSHLLLGNKGLNEKLVGDLTQELFSRRAALASEHPAASRIEAPPAEVNAAFPIHPGALAYYTDNQQSFLERYSDVLYIALMIISLIGSIAAARYGRKKQVTVAELPPHKKSLIELVNLLRASRKAVTHDELDEIAHRADDIFVETLDEGASEKGDDGQIALVAMTLDHLRSALQDRRKALKVLS